VGKKLQWVVPFGMTMPVEVALTSPLVCRSIMFDDQIHYCALWLGIES